MARIVCVVDHWSTAGGLESSDNNLILAPAITHLMEPDWEKLILF